ncbi:MAG: hypothetical protein GF329_12665 [Candidatus Lokiarchaeota archaeon]|nr:hypothetical protein [Candidatus Lokiarchaeota archaeon]
MIQFYDVGSLPFSGDETKFIKSLDAINSHETGLTDNYFEKKIVDVFIDKIKSGIDISNYPQFRDMNKMFLELIHGLQKTNGEYIEVNIPTIPEEKTEIPEVLAIKRNTKKIFQKINEDVRLKICITGPYTISSQFGFKEGDTFLRIGKVIEQIVEKNSFRNKYGCVEMLSLDEPTFGTIDDKLLDIGSDGREKLLKAWEGIFRKSKKNEMKTIIHLHDTNDKLFWDVPSLDIIESHVYDKLYSNNKTKKYLESRDKFLKASISISKFDTLIEKKIVSESNIKDEIKILEKIAEIWKEINNKRLDPSNFLENADLLEKRLIKNIDTFGKNRILYAGPECGLKSFPSYKCAMDYFKINSRTISNVNNKLNMIR